LWDAVGDVPCSLRMVALRQGCRQGHDHVIRIVYVIKALDCTLRGDDSTRLIS
jgi:hypothetical protein